MEEKTEDAVAWRVLLVGMCLLLLLTSGGLVYLLLHHRQLSDEMVSLGVQVQALSQSCRLQVSLPLSEPGEGGSVRGLRTLRRSRRNQGENPQHSLDKDEKDTLTLMTYSMVPVRTPCSLIMNVPDWKIGRLGLMDLSCFMRNNWGDIDMT